MSRPSILLVDDDPAVRSSISFALEIEGFDVAAFESAEEVVGREMSRRYACVVIDQRLPGMDGLSLLAWLHASGEQAPAIIITSNPTPRLLERVGAVGARLVEKPLLGDELATVARELIKQVARPLHA